MQILKVIVILAIVMSYMLLGCNQGPQQSQGRQEPSLEASEMVAISKEQERALEAFTTLQTGIDSKHKLYSTFAGIEQPCYPPDTSFLISRDEFSKALQQFVGNQSQRMGRDKCQTLARVAAMAQQEYLVYYCPGTFDASYAEGLPRSGTWVLPNVLDRRDVTLVW